MLAVRHPTLFELDKVIESCNSTKRRQPVCTMSKSERFPRIGRSTVNLPPGHYRMDVGMVLTKDTEVLASRLTRAKSAPRFSFCKERRVDNEDCLKGLSPKYLKDITLKAKFAASASVMRQTGGCAICAAHPELQLIAVGTGGDPAFLVFFEDSLRRKQRFEQRCDALAWHKKNPVLAVLSINAAMAKIQIFSATDGLAHFRLHVLGMHPATALCWARAHLLVAGPELCRCVAVQGRRPLFGNCSLGAAANGRAERTRIGILASPGDGLLQDPSERFLVTVHRTWWASELPKANAFRRRAVTETLLGCCGEVLQGHCQAASWAPAARGSAILATLGLQRDITVWRESAFEETPGFVAEARWSASDLQASAMVWVGKDTEELEDARDWWGEQSESLPLRPTRHSAHVRPEGPHKAELVVAGETTWCIELQSSPGGQGPLFSICRKLPELPGFDQSAGYGRSGGLFSVKKSGSASFNAWLCSPSGDLRRICLDENSTSVDAVAGSVLPCCCLPDAKRLEESPRFEVVDMALHEYWGLLALLLSGGRTLVWVAEIPESRACFDSGRYHLPQGDILSDEALSTADCPSFTSLVWIPGHRLPPRLLGFGRSYTLATSLDISGTLQPWSEACGTLGAIVVCGCPGRCCGSQTLTCRFGTFSRCKPARSNGPRIFKRREHCDPSQTSLNRNHCRRGTCSLCWCTMMTSSSSWHVWRQKGVVTFPGAE
ncbi:Dmxl2 [Symbiodinium sp. KB8]|nr:Dmxl2 [Symbiodinium sp. KB8]